MAAGLPLLREIVVDKLAVANLAEACARADIDGQALGELVFNNMMFIEFVKRADARIPGLRAALRRQNRILAAAIVV